MKAEKIYYNENVFRSKLEAIWAIFFDELNIPYVYEPERISIEGRNKKYLPDFYLPETYLRNKNNKGVYIEIKNEAYSEEDFSEIGSNFPGNIILFCGTPYYHAFQGTATNSDSGYQYGNDFYDSFGEYQRFWDNCMKVWVCSSCGTSKIEFMEGNYNECPVCRKRGGTPEDIEAAYSAYCTIYRHSEKLKIYHSGRRHG